MQFFCALERSAEILFMDQVEIYLITSSPPLTNSSSGIITLGDIMEILPFEDPVVVIQISGRTLRAALEASLSKWPATEG